MTDKADKGYIEKLCRIFRAGGYQRTLHYHNTPGKYERLYEEQIKYIADHYHTLSADNLKNRFVDGVGHSIIIGLFDGYRNNYDVMCPIMKKYGQTAWYLLVADFLDTPVKEQEGRLERYRMQYLLGEYKDRRYAMNWDEARLASQNHTIVNHSSTHFFLKPDSGRKDLEYEIYHSHDLIAKNTGVIPKVFSWLGGGEYGTNSAATEMLQEKGYEYLIGYELENIAPVIDGLPKTAVETKTEDEKKLPGCQKIMPEFTDEKLEEEINHHQSIMATIGIFSGVPAILPLYRAEAPQVGKDNETKEEDLIFASHFYRLAFYLRERLKITEWDAAHRALDVMAVNMIGEGFPYHLA